MIKTAQVSDLPAIAACHCAAFPGSLSTAMGKRYVARMLSWYLSTDKTFLFFLEKEGMCAAYGAGIIADGVLPTGSSSGMLRHSMGAAIFALLQRPWLIFHPELRAKYPLIFTNLAHILRLIPRRKSVRTEQRRREPGAGFVVLGVHPAHRRSGIGTAFLDEFERRATEEYGMRRMYLSVRPDNKSAIRIYESRGWVCVGEGSYEKRV